MKKIIRFLSTLLVLFPLVSCDKSQAPKVLDSIEITTLPNQLEYRVGDYINLDGMVVTANFTNGIHEVVEDYTCALHNVALSLYDTSVLISYKYEVVTKSAKFDIMVKEDELTERYKFEPNMPTTLPEIKINTPSGTDWATKYNLSSKQAGLIEYVPATISAEKAPNEEDNFSGIAAQVKVRGNYTLNYAKKPIRIKFETKRSMFGIGGGVKAKSWVLYAEWKDMSMLQNQTALYLGHKIMGSDGYYNTDFIYCRVYINDTYWGMYTLVEYQEIRKGKFDITEPDEDNPENANIGYLVEYDKHYKEEDINLGNGDSYTFTQKFGGKSLTTESGEPAKFGNKGFTIKSDCYSQKACNTVAAYFENTYMIAYYAMHEDKFYEMSEDYMTLVPSTETDPFTVVNKYMDVQAWVDMFIISEICKDPDLDDGSLYLDCDLNPSRFKRLTFEGLWDFDSAFGIRVGWESNKGYYSLNNDHQGTINPWFGVLNGCDWFMDLVEEKWLEMIEAKVFEDTIEFIELNKTQYESEYTMNFEKWKSRISGGVNELVSDVNKNKTQKDAANYLLNWLKTRIANLNLLITGEDLVLEY